MVQNGAFKEKRFIQTVSKWLFKMVLWFISIAEKEMVLFESVEKRKLSTCDAWASKTNKYHRKGKLVCNYSYYLFMQ